MTVKYEVDTDYMIRIRRELHMYPELSFDLPKTLGLVRRELDKMNIPYTEKYGKSSIVAYVNKDYPDLSIGIRADMDALPINEINDVPYRSKIAGRMHACGHDVHTAALLGTLKSLNDIRDEIRARLVFIFQASEEGPSGAKLMVEDGVTDEFNTIVGCHVDNTLDVGSIMVRENVALASSDYFNVALHGLAGHGAAPHGARDALAMGVKLYNEIMSISRTINPSIPHVISIPVLKGGERANIIADYCYMEGTVRTHDAHVASLIREKIKECSHRVADQYKGRAEVTINAGLPPLLNDRDVVNKILAGAEKQGVDIVYPVIPPPMYSEDFAYYLTRKPGAFIFLGTGNKEKGFVNMTHNNNFDVDEGALEFAVRTFIGYVLESMEG